MDATSVDLASANKVRAAERQRISRELHNSTSQLVVALQLQVGQLRSCLAPSTAEHLWGEIADTLQSIHESIKQIGMQRGEGDEDGLEERQVQTAKLFYLLSTTNRGRRKRSFVAAIAE